MPIFDYVCDKCEKEFELLVGVVDSETTLKCPHCGASTITKKITSGKFVKPYTFRGKTW